MNRTPVWIFLAAFCIATLSAFAVETRSGHDPGVDFSSHQAYKWVTGERAETASAQQIIESAVRAQLDARGLHEDSGAPDLWVVAHAAEDGRARIDPGKYGYAYRWRSWGADHGQHSRLGCRHPGGGSHRRRDQRVDLARHRARRDQPEGKETRERDQQGRGEALRRLSADRVRIWRR